jgi:hypothetical protein
LNQKPESNYWFSSSLPFSFPEVTPKIYPNLSSLQLSSYLHNLNHHLSVFWIVAIAPISSRFQKYLS